MIRRTALALAAFALALCSAPAAFAVDISGVGTGTTSCPSTTVTNSGWGAPPSVTSQGALCTANGGPGNPGTTTTPFSKLVANNTTSVAVDASPGTLYEVRVWNISATPAWLKLYDAAQGSTTCGSGTPVFRELIPAATAGQGAVILIGGGFGHAFATAITACVTTGIADADTTAPPASSMIYEADYK